MVRIRKSNLQLKYEILNILSDRKDYSFSYLEKHVKSHWNTIKYQCDELEIFNAVIVEDSKVQIKELGFEYLGKLKKKVNCH